MIAVIVAVVQQLFVFGDAGVVPDDWHSPERLDLDAPARLLKECKPDEGATSILPVLQCLARSDTFKQDVWEKQPVSATNNDVTFSRP